MGRNLNQGSSLGQRHLRWETFERRVYKGPPSIEPIAGTPRIHLFIEPGGSRIGARFFGKAAGAIPSPLAEVSIREISVATERALEISTSNKNLYRSFYILCCSVADLVQVEKEPIVVAVKKTLAAWAALIRKKQLLPLEEELGLIGELIFLKHVAGTVGWPAAANSWYGPMSEEHDFVLPLTDVEVKTTTQEARMHHIGSLTQLLPKPGRALNLVSIQITRSGEGQGSFSLADLVASEIVMAARSSRSAADSIREQLRSRGWADEDASNYSTRYRLRSEMTLSSVAAGFPAILPSTLISLGSEASARICKVKYEINVDGLGVSEGNPQFNRQLFGRRRRG